MQYINMGISLFICCMQDSQQKHPPNSPGRTLGLIKLSLILLGVFSIGFIPFTLYLYGIWMLFDRTIWWHWVFVPVILYWALIIILYAQIVASGVIISLFHYRYKAGTYPYTFQDKNTFRWIVLCSLYTPFRKVMEVFPVGNLRNRYYRWLGMHIGENTLVGGVIKDPCMTSIGANTTMGEYAIMYGHIQDFSRGTITMNPIKVGNNCVIGAGAIIMPGALIEDDVVVAAGAVVTQNQVLKKNHIYAGIPAKPIQNKNH